MRKVHYKEKLMNIKGATIWLVEDIECWDCNANKFVNMEKYSKGKIVKNYSTRYVIAKFDENRIVKVHKKYILINLPEIMQTEVIFSISNATSALYNIHGNIIEGVTGSVLYPNAMGLKEKDSYAVGVREKVKVPYDMEIDGKVKAPLMYSVAKKLYGAEQKFLEQGITIKIYDTYRPYSVTKYLYSKTMKVADKYSEFLNRVVNGFEYSQRWFLAEHASSHNYGVAIDMTLVDINTGNELNMQTKMHDLSVYSVVDYNNENAKKLARVMVKEGFSPLRSEWWHFQDNSAKVNVLDFQVS